MADGVVPDPRAANGRGQAGRHGVPGLRMVLCLRREPASVGVARRIVDTALRSVGVDPDCRADLTLALSEACTNVVKHAAGADEYEVRLTFDEDCCIVEIIDTGRHAMRLPIDLTPADPTDERGRGLSIIARSTDSLQLTPRRPHGLALRFTKRLT
jgi:serine/threonine-protein kinase RsbW